MGDGQGVLGPGKRVVSVRGVCRAAGGVMGARGRGWGSCTAGTNGFAFGDSGALADRENWETRCIAAVRRAAVVVGGQGGAGAGPRRGCV